MKYGLLILNLFFTCLAFPQYSTIHISSMEGMTNSSVNGLLEDVDNVLWLGTWDGLNSYNGRDIKTYRYDKENKNSISSNIVYQITEKDSENLWVATNNGINKFNKKTQRFDRFLEGYSGFKMAVMSGETSICYVRDNGLFYYDTLADTFCAINDDQYSNNVEDLKADAQNNLYIFSRGGIITRCKVSNENGKLLMIEKTVIANNKDITHISTTSDKLIISYSSFFKIIDVNTLVEEVVMLPDAKNIDNIACRGTTIFIHYNKSYFARYDILKKKFIDIKVTSDFATVFSMCVGAQGILWIGSDGQGVFGLHEYSSPFKTYKMDATVRCFAEDNDQRIWVGTKGNGIQLVDKKKKTIVKQITEADGLLSNSIFVLKKNSFGDIFIGADGQGISILTQKQTIEQLIIPPEMFSPINVYSILLTNDSTLWAGTNGNGFYKINIARENGKYIAKHIARFLANEEQYSMRSNNVYSIQKNTKNKDLLWIGTRGDGGVNLFDIASNKFRSIGSFDCKLVLSSNDILCLMNDKNDNLWIGTSYGLNRFSTKEPYSNIDYSERREFINNTIHGFLEDDKNDVWISTNYGILHLDVATSQIIHYTVNNGLHSNEFADGAYYQGKDSTFYFGGMNGFTSFYPRNIKPRDYSPKIYLSDLQINNVNYNVYDRLVDNTLSLAYSEPYLSLTFIANDFINNQNCEYNYRIKGFVDEWIYNGKQPNIKLTKLPPGEYTLEVKSTNGDGVWSDNTYTLNINIGYPWWRSNISYCIYFLLVAGLIYIFTLIIKNRIRLSKQILLERVEKEHQQEIHESKLNFFTNVAHEFFTPLSLIYAPSQLLLERENIDPYSKKYLQIIKNNADRMQKLIKELMDFRKIESGYVSLHPEEVDIVDAIEKIIENYTEVAKINNIEVELHCDSAIKLITDKTCLDKIIFNLISNAFKYTPSDNIISISAHQVDKAFFFVVKNSGVGLTSNQMKDIFDRFKIFENTRLQNSSANGIGLNLTKNLVELLGGTISVESKDEDYVQFSVNLPPLESSLINESLSVVQTGDQQMNSTDLNLSERKKSILILIVEDDINIRELIRDILSPLYNIKEASDGLEGLAEVEMNMPDIIISDIMMPNMDGIAFINHLKSDIKTSHIPIISLSAKNDIKDHINAYKHGADLYIEKPFNPAHILTAVENIIDKYAVLQQYFNSKRSGIKVKEGIEICNEDEQLIQEIIIFIEKNIDDDLLSPTAIYEYLNISKSVFYDRLKKITGKTPSEFIKIIRLEYASTLLKNTQLTTSEIIFKSGFASRSYFYREFAKHFNMSPNEYRKQM